MTQSDIPIIVLAAGSGLRMAAETRGTAKLLLEVGDKPLLLHTLDALIEQVSPERIFVVVDGNYEVGLPESATTIAGLAHQRGTAVVHSLKAHLGMMWSLACGLEHAVWEYPDASGAVVVLADTPGSVAALNAVLARIPESPRVPIAIDRDPPIPHPVYLPRALFPDLPLPGSPESDHGLRDTLHSQPTVWIDDVFPQPVDVDRPEDVLVLQQQLQR